jgi:hypothetical protein
MRGPIRKKTGFPGQEELNEGTYPEKNTLSRRNEPLGVARGACLERLAGVFAKRSVRAT